MTMSELKPLVSVIVPVYNSHHYLRYCIDSIVQQSYRRLQILLVDDGSTDSSPRICDEYAAHDERIRVIHQVNSGIAGAQNTGLDAAEGDYIAFCDNDDIMHRNNIEILLHALEITGADMSKGRWKQIGVSSLSATARCSAHQSVENPNLSVITDSLHAYQTVFCKSLRLLGGSRVEARYFNEANWCRLYKKEIWDGLRFVTGHYAQDIRMAGPLYARMSRVVDVDKILYYWLQEPESVTHSKRDFSFWHDNVTAAIANYRFTLSMGLVPYRNYFGMVSSMKDERTGMAGKATEDPFIRAQIEDDAADVSALTRELGIFHRCLCNMMVALRRLENKFYDSHVHSLN